MKFISFFLAGDEIYCNSNDGMSVAGLAMNLGIRHTRKGLVIKEKIFGGRNLATRPERVQEFTKWVNMQEVQAGDIFHLIDITADRRFGMICAVGDTCQTLR